jgi:hypothetical protein
MKAKIKPDPITHDPVIFEDDVVNSAGIKNSGVAGHGRLIERKSPNAELTTIL